MTVIDVGSPMNLQMGHIQSIKNHPFDQIQSYRGIKAKVHYVICQTGMRITHASRYLANKEYELFNVKCSMS